jgi:signal transduction histidine kinase
MNILNNAVKYNDSEKPGIDIRFLQANGRLHIRFEDNGIGLEKAERKKIFRKFYQTKRAEILSPRGSGLGLYLVQNIARMHRGKVIAEKRPDEKGSVFTLILPFQPQQA